MFFKNKVLKESMDPIIQGLTQSAIVQKLSENEHHVKRFTKDIPDNAPYRSFSKVEIESFRGSRTRPDSSQTFRISRNGYLNRMYLKMRVFMSNPPDNALYELNVDGTGKSLGPEFFANFFESCSISIGGRHVETLFAENILFNAFTRKSGNKEHILKSLKGYFSVNGELYGMEEFTNVGGKVPPHVDFLIPLDFSIFRFYKDSLDANFLQEIQIEFSKKQQVVFQANAQTSFTKSTLVCIYHNVHNHFRANIRNANFEKESSTLITTANHKVESIPTILSIPVVPQFPPTRSFPAHQVYKYPIQLNIFATDILVTFRRKKVILPSFYIGEMHRVPNQYADDITDDSRYLKFTLKANDRVLFEKFHHELSYEDTIAYSGSVDDSIDSSLGYTFYHKAGSANLDGLVGSDSVTPIDGVTPSDFARMFKTAPCMYRIPLTMFGTDEFLNGGLDMTSLSNVEFIIDSDAMNENASEFEGEEMTPEIVIRHKQIMRLDGKTGNISL